MIRVDKKVWEIHDPDKVMSYDRESFDLNIPNFFGDIHPREDLLSFENKATNYIIDFGYYGGEVSWDGHWVVYVINGNIEEPWERPVERYETREFLNGIDNVQAMLNKYT